MSARYDEALPQLGAPNPELRNSPITDDIADFEPSVPQDTTLELGVCYFNGEAFPVGTFVASGPEVLKCTEGGVWLRCGEREAP